MVKSVQSVSLAPFFPLKHEAQQCPQLFFRMASSAMNSGLGKVRAPLFCRLISATRLGDEVVVSCKAGQALLFLRSSMAFTANSAMYATLAFVIFATGRRGEKRKQQLHKLHEYIRRHSTLRTKNPLVYLEYCGALRILRSTSRY